MKFFVLANEFIHFFRSSYINPKNCGIKKDKRASYTNCNSATYKIFIWRKKAFIKFSLFKLRKKWKHDYYILLASSAVDYQPLPMGILKLKNPTKKMIIKEESILDPYLINASYANHYLPGADRNGGGREEASMLVIMRKWASLGFEAAFR